MLFLHLPVSDDLTLDCQWDEERDALVVSELDPEGAIALPFNAAVRTLLDDLFGPDEGAAVIATKDEPETLH